MECVKLGSMTEFNTLLDKSPVTVIDFSASWCGPCKMLSPQLDELAKNPSIQGAKFFKIDVDESGDVAEAMSIQAMPTVMIFKNGKKFDFVVGANIAKIKDIVVKALQD